MKDSIKKKEFSRVEEIFNAITHYLGALLSIAGLVILIVASSRTGNVAYIISSIVFCIALIFMYSTSGTYHILKIGKTKFFWKKLDHIAIYVLIAASYTPFIFTVLHGWTKWAVFGIQWGLVAFGVLFKLFYTGKFKMLSTLIYLLMGWTIVIVFKEVKLGINPLSFNLLLAGGITYTVGTIAYMLDRFKFVHTAWHLFVMGGSLCHFLSILFLIK